MSSGYFDDLSDCDSVHDDSESNQEDNEEEEEESKPSARGRRATKMSARTAQAVASPKHHSSYSLSRCIIHVDVDCFYCQCEKIDRNLPDDRPFAIGQKHIIVTCDYNARRLGVKKLESRDNAYAKCPNLLVLEGSDLTRYRIHARRIYDAFRKACKQISISLPVAKGSMDEMSADLTLACINDREDGSRKLRDPHVHVYGDYGTEQTVLTEDQTGDSVVVVDNVSQQGEAQSDPTIATRLQRAASLAVRIRACIFRETGFCVTMGVSTNPLLAKLATGLQKPGIANLLYPWRSKQLLDNLPIRKLHGAGRRTLQVLDPCLRKRFPDRTEPVVWTCGDLRAVPDYEIAECLAKLPSREPSKHQAKTLLLKCTGIDNTLVEDDLGGLPKTVSAEDSFRRGTVTTRDAVMKAVKDVCSRLPALLHERYRISNNPLLAHPGTLRLTVRLVIDPDTASRKLHSTRSRRRPFETFSKQTPFPGKKLLHMKESQKPDFIYQHMLGMLRTLVLDKPSFDVTRLNLAGTNFDDLNAGSGTNHGSPSKQSILSQTLKLTQTVSQSQSEQAFGQKKMFPGSESQMSQSTTAHRPYSSQSPLTGARDKPATASLAKTYSSKSSREANLQFSDIDPAVLEELPPDIRSQVLGSFSVLSSRKKSRIEDFFKPVKKKK